MELNTIADALSGLQANQSYMDVVGNNIANVNTTGYKTQSIRFEDLMNQSLGYGSAASGQMEGVNPFQVGMGVGQGAVDQINTQGTVEDTGRDTDMAIQGDGYFVVSNGQQSYYTRDGSFSVAPDGTLENAATGMAVQGWTTTNANGSINTTTGLAPIKIPLGSQAASATTSMVLNGNLDASQAVYAAGPPATGGQYTSTLTAYDSEGNAYNLTLNLHKTANNQWSYTITAPTGATVSGGGSGQLNFDPNGNLLPSSTTPALQLTYANGAANGNVAIDFSKISQVAQNSQVNVATSDGSPGGTVSTFSVGKDGVVTAVYSNGTNKSIGQIALANFRNPDGLERQGNNLYAVGVNSGSAQTSVAGAGTMGSIVTGELEGSNVDLAAQFAQMIQAQQGYNANTKVVTTTDNMLQSVMSIIP